jgi:hypothetical protein
MCWCFASRSHSVVFGLSAILVCCTSSIRSPVWCGTSVMAIVVAFWSLKIEPWAAMEDSGIGSLSAFERQRIESVIVLEALHEDEWG